MKISQYKVIIALTIVLSMIGGIGATCSSSQALGYAQKVVDIGVQLQSQLTHSNPSSPVLAQLNEFLAPANSVLADIKAGDKVAIVIDLALTIARFAPISLALTGNSLLAQLAASLLDLAKSYKSTAATLSTTQKNGARRAARARGMDIDQANQTIQAFIAANGS